MAHAKEIKIELTVASFELRDNGPLGKDPLEEYRSQIRDSFDRAHEALRQHALGKAFTSRTRSDTHQAFLNLRKHRLGAFLKDKH